MVKFKCNGCLADLTPDKFYVKYLSVVPSTRSDWSSRCIECTKTYKAAWYAANKDTVNGAHKEYRLKNHEASLKREAVRRLAKAKDPSRILRHRKSATLSCEDLYLHKKALAWRVGAKNRNLEWSLKLNDIKEMLLQQNRKCRYSDHELVLAANHPDTISLDRIDSTKGYVRSNVVLCSTRVNLMKLDMSLTEFESIITDLRSHLRSMHQREN